MSPRREVGSLQRLSASSLPTLVERAALGSAWTMVEGDVGYDELGGADAVRRHVEEFREGPTTI